MTRICLLLVFLASCSNALLFRGSTEESARKKQYARMRWRFPDLATATIAELRHGLQLGYFTSEDLVRAYEKRTEETQDVLHSVLEINHYALEDAREIDAKKAWRVGATTGRKCAAILLTSAILKSDTVPILLKDTIGTARPDEYALSSTGGSYALLDAFTDRDSTVVEKLRAAGAIILGKTNVSQCVLWLHLCGWAPNPPNGWSSRGGQTTGAYHKDQDPGGSSSGSGVAVAVGLAPAAIATESDASIISPARRAALCGIKPTRGLVSRAGIIPFSKTQDTVGPVARSCQDAATILNVIAGPDVARDEATAEIANDPLPDYTAACRYDGLMGARLGIPTSYFDAYHAPPEFKAFAPFEMSAFNAAIPVIEKLGARVTHDANFPELDRMHHKEVNESVVSFSEMPEGFKQYLAGLKTNPHKFDSLKSYLEWAEHSEEWPEGVEHVPLETALTSKHVHGLESAEYLSALESNLYVGSHGSILGALDQHQLDALIMPSTLAPGVAALAGYPVVTVPSGWTPEDVTVKYNAAHTLVERGPSLPLGLSFVGRRFSEEKLIAYACAFEHATRFRDRVTPWVLPETQLADVVASSSPRARDEL